MSLPKKADEDPIIKKLKAMVANLQKMNVVQDLKMKRLAQEIRELKVENTYLKEKIRNG